MELVVRSRLGCSGGTAIISGGRAYPAFVIAHKLLSGCALLTATIKGIKGA